ncbi:MAG: DUF2868 domain-containing protein [Accumulibacter sp.]|uniref:DUF2868 domain-containing protein n=1 Tax=Accumulibacter sp. TaxID=2053492 RepID=UPI002FC38E12
MRALEIVAVRAFETADRAHVLWSDGDRAWASRAAAEVVGEGAADADFVAERARLALGRFGERFPVIPRAVRALSWRPWLAGAIAVAAFIGGLLVDRIGGGQRINILMPPVLALIAWNIAVYLLLAARFCLRRPGNTLPQPWRRAMGRLATGLHPRPGGELGAAIAHLASDWSRLSAPLHGARAARILHLAAALLATGVLTGFYLRGLAFAYEATWESTFLAASDVHRLLAIALAPGTALSGIPLPTAEEIAAIRAPAGENAAQWLHLLAATVAAIVIVPRLVLALLAWLVERRRSRSLPIDFAEPYFDRLLRDFRGGPLRLTVIPYSYTLPPEATSGLERLVTHALGGNTLLTVGPAVRYGEEDAPPHAGAEDGGGRIIALFNATATPEREVHGAFLRALGSPGGGARRLVALVDESSFLARGRDTGRIEGRRTAWRELCATLRVGCVFADLAAVASAGRTGDGSLDAAASALAGNLAERG